MKILHFVHKKYMIFLKNGINQLYNYRCILDKFLEKNN